jgi:hypothetical protein
MRITLTELKHLIKKIILKENFDDFKNKLMDLKGEQYSPNSKSKPYLEGFKEKFFPHLTPDQLQDILKKLYSEIASGIGDIRIERLLKAGSMGIVYELENDYILKLYIDDYSHLQGGESDLEWFSVLHSMQYSGIGSVNQPHIIKYGSVKYQDNRSIKYVIMSKVIPFSDDIKYTRRDADLIGYQLEQIRKNYDQGVNDVLRSIKDASEYNKYLNQIYAYKIKRNLIGAFEYDSYYMQTNGLSDVEVKSIIRMLEEFKKTTTKNIKGSEEIHAGNFGRLESSGLDNPIFVLFDK